MYFTPPEILENRGYNEKSDVWSIGLIMFILLTGKNPIQGIGNKQTLQNIQTKNLNIQGLVNDKTIDEEAGDLLTKMLCRDPVKRISAVEAINDPWVIKYSKSKAEDSSITQETRDKVRETWNYYYLQTLCMRYFGIHSLDSMNIDMIKSKAEEHGKQLGDLCTYDELYNILLEVSENSKETVTFELDCTLSEMGIKSSKLTL